MSETITYTKEQREALFDASWRGGGRGLGTVRAVKMLRPECSNCQNPETIEPGWWNNCERDGHDPYFTLQPKVLRVPKYVEDEDGDLVLDEEATAKASRTKFVRMANVVEVMFTTASNNGVGPERFRRTKGFAYPEEKKVAPFCEASGCGKAFPTIGTVFGNFCSVRHAKLVAADAMEIALTAWVDPLTGAKGKMLQQRELAEIDI